MGSAKFGRFRHDSGGIAAVFKSGAMTSALKAVADPIGAACEAEAAAYVSEVLGIAPDEVRKRPFYRHGAKTLANTAIGYVDARGLGKANEVENHSLSRRNH